MRWHKAFFSWHLIDEDGTVVAVLKRDFESNKWFVHNELEIMSTGQKIYLDHDLKFIMDHPNEVWMETML